MPDWMGPAVTPTTWHALAVMLGLLLLMMLFALAAAASRNERQMDKEEAAHDAAANGPDRSSHP